MTEPETKGSTQAESEHLQREIEAGSFADQTVEAGIVRLHQRPERFDNSGVHSLQDGGHDQDVDDESGRE